ncbi:hypothetical protein D3C73_1244500 [compost metagenome]
MKSLAGFVISLLLGAAAKHLSYTWIWFLAAASLLLSVVVLLYLNARHVRSGKAETGANFNNLF